MSSIKIDVSANTISNTENKTTKKLPFILLCTLFLLWAVGNNLNDILLPQFQSAFSLNNFQAGLIQSSFYFGYFLVPIPAGLVMNRFGYKAGILFGLFFYAIGATMFVPAAHLMNYSLFLFSLFIIAAGLGFLETAANPFVMVLGPRKSQGFRINAAQSCNSFGAILAVLFGQSLILNGVNHKSATDIAAMSADKLAAYNASLVSTVQMPYLIIATVVIIIAIFITLTKFPNMNESSSSEGTKNIPLKEAVKYLVKIKHWRWAVLSQFCYVGAQTAIWSYMIRYAVVELKVSPANGANYLTATMFCFFIGRVTGTYLMKKFPEEKILSVFSFISALLCAASVIFGGKIGLLAIVLSSAFMSIQYPTIFSIGIKDLGKYTKIGSSFIVMGIIGGGLVTPAMGYVSDISNRLPTAELIPTLCFVVIFIFATFKSNVSN